MICTLSIVGILAWVEWLSHAREMARLQADLEAQRAREKRWAAESPLKDPPA